LREEAKKRLSETKQLKIPKDTLVELYYKEQLSASAIASQLGYSETAIQSQINHLHYPQQHSSSTKAKLSNIQRNYWHSPGKVVQR